MARLIDADRLKERILQRSQEKPMNAIWLDTEIIDVIDGAPTEGVKVTEGAMVTCNGGEVTPK